MALLETVYNTIFKRSSTFAAFIVGATFFTERGIDATADFLFNRINEGKLWEHIHKEE